MKKLLLLLMFSIVLLGVVSAVNECGNDNSFLGTFSQNQTITLKQTCDTCTFVNLSSVNFPNTATSILNTAMTKNGINFNSTFTNTTLLGCYSYITLGDKGGVNTAETIYFKISPQGWTSTAMFYLIFLIIIALVFTLGVVLKNNYIMFFGSFLIFLLGIFVIVNGIDVVKSVQTTKAIGFVLWGLSIIGMYLSVEGWLAEGGFN